MQTFLRTLPAVLIVACVIAPVRFAPAADVDDAAVEAAIQRGVAYLWSQWNDQRYWESTRSVNPGDVPWGMNGGGETALCTYALLAAGESHLPPRMAQTIEWLGKLDVNGTYTLALRANVYALLPQGEYRDELRDDVRQIVNSVVQEGDRTNLGGYNYWSVGRQRESGYDNSNSQFGVLGAWAGQRQNIEIPRRYWELVWNHWERTQHEDGGWDYHSGEHRSYGTMTAGGIASLFVCFDALYADKFVTCTLGDEFPPPQIRKALRWFDENFAVSRVPRAEGTPGQDRVYYYLYGMERVGLASGYKYFGQNDWYSEGVRHLLERQQGDGSWGSRENTAFALLFLARGRHPILFNHLQYDGDWDNRPRALANLTDWISRTFERTVNWQIIQMDVPVREWHDAPILYITGARAPKFTEEQLAKLREYVDQGGTLLSVTECNAQAFTLGMQRVYQQLFPEYPLTALDRAHPLYTRETQFPIARPVPALAVSNGVRLLAVHVPMDLSRSWQVNARSTARPEFEFAANLYVYQTDRTSLRNRGSRIWPEARTTGGRTVSIARVQYPGNWNPEPGAWVRLGILMGNLENVNLQAPAVPIEELDAARHPVAHMTGAGELALTDAHRDALKRYMQAGGLLVLEAAGGNEAFRRSAEQTLDTMFGALNRRQLAQRHALYNLPGRQIDEVTYRRTTRLRQPGLKTPSLEAVLSDGRIVAIYSPLDLSAGLVGYQAFGVDGYAPSEKPESDSAYRVMRNILLWAEKGERTEGQ